MLILMILLSDFRFILKLTHTLFDLRFNRDWLNIFNEINIKRKRPPAGGPPNWII